MGLSAQIAFDIAQRFPVGQLRKCHGEELIQTGKILDLVQTVDTHESLETRIKYAYPADAA